MVGNALHAIDFDFYVASVWQRVRHLVNCLLVNLHAMDGKAWAGVKLLVTYVALEMLGFLMLYEDLFVVEFAIAVPSGFEM